MRRIVIHFSVLALFFTGTAVSPAHATTFNCGTSGTYSVVGGELANSNNSCFGAVVLDASVTTITYSTNFPELTSISIPATTLVIPNGAFNAPKLTSITVHADNPNYSSSNGSLYSKDGKKLIIYPSGRTDASFSVPSSVEEITDCAFRQPQYLETATVPSSVLIMDGGFLSCSVVDSTLTAINVDAANPNYSSLDGVLFNKEKTTLISYPSSKRAISFTVPASVTRLISLVQTRYLESILLPDGLITIDTYAFQNSFKLKSIDIPASVTAFGDYPFMQSPMFESFTVSAASATLKAIDGVLYSKNGLTLIEYPEGKKNETFEIQDGVTTVLSQWIWGNTYLKKITVPSSVSTINYGYTGSHTSTESLLNFRGNSSLTSIAGQYASKINYCGTPNAVLTAFAASSSAVLSCKSSPEFSLSSSTENVNVGQAIVGYSLNFVTEPDEYSIAPALNNGTLTFNSVTGLISGTPATSSTATTYTISGMNISGIYTRTFTLTIQSTPNSDQAALALAAQKAAEAKREAEKQAARNEIWDCLSDSRTITINNFSEAEIYGVTKKNYDYVIQDINYKIFDESDTALIESRSQTIFVVEQVVKKYVILDVMCYPGSFSQFTANDLASVDLIPYKNRNVITYNLRQLPLDQRDDYIKIENAINSEIVALETRKERLDEVLSRNSPEDNLSPEPAKNGIFPCGSGGTYTVVSGRVTGSNKCAGKLTIVSSVTAINDYAFSSYRSTGRPSFSLIEQEPEITELVIPKTVLSIGESAFADNKFLTSISISNSVKTIGRDAFKQSNNVTSLTIGTGAAIIESDTYQEFRYLTKLVVPEGVTRIDGGAFSELYSVTSLTLPSTLTTLGQASLRGMHSLRTINIPAGLSSAYDPFHYLWYAPLSVPYLCSTTGASNTASVNAYFATLIAYNTTAGRCANSFDAPEIIGSHRKSSTSASVKFTAPKNFGAGSTLTSFEVIVFPGGKRTSFPSDALFLNGAFTQKVTISSLNPGTSYWFEVVAINNESPFIASPPSGRRYVSAE